MNPLGTRISAGLLMYRLSNGEVQVLLVHPGGPVFRNKDDGVWTIPKGEIESGEDALAAARREFEEETGFKPSPPFVELSPITQKGGKRVLGWSFEGDCDATRVRSNVFEMEWPPRSGRRQEFPEIDRAEWFALSDAKRKIKPAQIPLLEQLHNRLAGQGPPGKMG